MEEVVQDGSGDLQLQHAGDGLGQLLPLLHSWHEDLLVQGRSVHSGVSSHEVEEVGGWTNFFIAFELVLIWYPPFQAPLCTSDSEDDHAGRYHILLVEAIRSTDLLIIRAGIIVGSKLCEYNKGWGLLRG